MDDAGGDRLSIRVASLELRNPVICGSGEPVMTEAGIRAALRAGAAGVIAKSVNEQEAAARQLDRADYALLDAKCSPASWNKSAVSLLCRSGLAQREVKDWFGRVAAVAMLLVDALSSLLGRAGRNRDWRNKHAG